MADSTEGDTEVQDLGVLASSLIALIAGLVIHSFIIGVNVNDWWKGRSVTPVDLIVTSLGISQMCAQCADTLYLFVDTLSLRNLDLQVTLATIDVVYAFLIYTNVWQTALLSIVFCLKISNLQTRLFLYLRRMILQRTGYSILASVLLAAFNSCISLSFTISEKSKGRTYNTTTDSLFMDCVNTNYLYNFATPIFIPLLFYYISSVLLFNSLYHHTTRMKMSSNLSINLETYYSAMKFLSFTFIYITVYFIGYFVIAFYYYFYCVTFPWLYTVLDFLPVLHSSCLIYRTAKLRNQMSKILQNVIDFLFQKKNTATGESIEEVAQ